MEEGRNAGRSIRWLRVLSVGLTILLISGIGGAVLLIATLVIQATTGYSMPISFEVNRASDPGALPPGHRWSGPSPIWIDDPTLPQTALKLAGAAAPFALLWIVARTLRQVIADAAAGNPFSDRNLRRVHRLGLVLLFGGIGVMVITPVTQWAIGRLSLGEEVGGPMFLTEPPYLPLVGVVVLAVSEVMRHGAALRAELDTVI